MPLSERQPITAQDRPTVYFVSDCHLAADRSAADRDRQQRLVRFLRSIDPTRSVLYLVGDLFDFWFTYRSSMPSDGLPIIAQLWALRQAGLPIAFVAGNHDYWAVPFLREALGIDAVPDGFVQTIHGRRFLIVHGDGLGSGDRGYKLLKRVLRSPVAIALYRLLHPDLGIPLALACSQASRAQDELQERACIDRLHREVGRPAFDAGHDVVICGHYHLPLCRREGDRAMVVLGDWIHHFSLLRVERGELALLACDADGCTRPLGDNDHRATGTTPPASTSGTDRPATGGAGPTG
ncbi:MAG: UDP-2,3-diacylglucosamine diphosphatase [Candidatus Eiseniibacteriota bacterium]